MIQYRNQLEGRIRACAKTICEKYINPPITTDFAILFLPTEGLYAEVLRQAGLFEGVQREHHVTLAGPSTLCAILNALQMGFRSLAIEQRSSEVWKVLGAVKTEFVKYNDVVDRLGKQLNTAVGSVEKLAVRSRAMNRSLRQVEGQSDEGFARKIFAFEDEGAEALDVAPLISNTGEAVDPIRASATVAGSA